MNTLKILRSGFDVSHSRSKVQVGSYDESLFITLCYPMTNDFIPAPRQLHPEQGTTDWNHFCEVRRK